MDPAEIPTLGSKIDLLTDKARLQDRVRAAQQQRKERIARQAAEAKKLEAEEAELQAERATQDEEKAAQDKIDALRARLQNERRRSNQARLEADQAVKQKAQQEQAIEAQQTAVDAAANEKKKQALVEADFKVKVDKFCPEYTAMVAKVTTFQREKMPQVSLMNQAGDKIGACAALKPAFDDVKKIRNLLLTCARDARAANEAAFADNLLRQAGLAKMSEEGFASLVEMNECGG